MLVSTTLLDRSLGSVYLFF